MARFDPAAMEALAKSHKERDTDKAPPRHSERKLRTYTSPPGRVPDVSEELAVHGQGYVDARNRFWGSLRKKCAYPAKSVKL